MTTPIRYPQNRAATYSQREPIWPRVVYWSERVRDWWPDLSRACEPCGGMLTADPPDTPTPGPGVVACLQCGREVADVVDRRRPTLTAANFSPERRGRPPKAVSR